MVFAEEYILGFASVCFIPPGDEKIYLTTQCKQNAICLLFYLNSLFFGKFELFRRYLLLRSTMTSQPTPPPSLRNWH